MGCLRYLSLNRKLSTSHDLTQIFQDIFNSAFKDFQYQGNFGLFQTDNYIIFHVDKFIPLNLLVFIPAIVLGFVGGVLGALFTFINLKVSVSYKTDKDVFCISLQNCGTLFYKKLTSLPAP